MELAMTLPIFLIVLLGVLEFSLLFFARGSVVEASRIGARHASYRGVSEQDVKNRVREVLSPQLHHGLVVEAYRTSERKGIATVIVRVPMAAAAPDLLWPVGFGLRGREIIAETRMVME